MQIQKRALRQKKKIAGGTTAVGMRARNGARPIADDSAAISQRGCGSHPGAALIDPSTPRRRLAASQSRVYFHSGGLFYHLVGGVVELQRNRQAYRGPR